MSKRDDMGEDHRRKAQAQSMSKLESDADRKASSEVGQG
jgi:hypothetical protein